MQAFITHTRSGPPFTRHTHMHTHQTRHSKHHCGLTLASARHQRIPLDKFAPICHTTIMSHAWMGHVPCVSMASVCHKGWVYAFHALKITVLLVQTKHWGYYSPVYEYLCYGYVRYYYMIFYILQITFIFDQSMLNSYVACITTAELWCYMPHMNLIMCEQKETEKIKWSEMEMIGLVPPTAVNAPVRGLGVIPYHTWTYGLSQKMCT